MITLIFLVYGIIWTMGKIISVTADARRTRQAETERIDRIERKQTQQEEKLERHEDRLDDQHAMMKEILFKIEQTDKKIDHLTVTLEDLNESFDLACQNAEHYHAAGDTVKEERAKNRVRTLRNQIHATELKLGKARHDRATFCDRLEVA